MTTFAELNTKKARIAHIRNMLENDTRWALRALIRIFEHQTSDEQMSESTHHWNNVGFNGADAPILSSFAKQVQKGWNLNEKQIGILHRRIPKYARQLERLAQ